MKKMLAAVVASLCVLIVMALGVSRVVGSAQPSGDSAVRSDPAGTFSPGAAAASPGPVSTLPPGVTATRPEPVSMIAPSTNSTSDSWGDYAGHISQATGITLELTWVGMETYRDKLMLMIASGEMADLSYLSEYDIHGMQDFGLFEDLGQAVLSPGVRERFLPGVLGDPWDGYYMAPVHLDVYALWFNVDMMDEIGLELPRSPDEYLEADLVQRDGAGRLGHVTKREPFYLPAEMATWISLFDGDFYNWSDPGTRRAMAYMKELLLADAATGALQYYSDEPALFLASRDASSALLWNLDGYSWFYDNIIDDFNLQVRALETASGEQKTVSISSGFVLDAHSGNKDAAIRVLRYMTSQRGSQAGAELMGWYPPRLDYWQTLEPATALEAQYRELALNTTMVPLPLYCYGSSPVREDLGYCAYEYITGSITLDDFCARAQVLTDEWQNGYR